MIWTAPHTTVDAPAWDDAEWIQQTNAAFKSYHSVLALARSPLADSELVRPLLVLDDRSPTATERGQALRLLLRWAVTQLAPTSPRYPLGTYRPMDDPTWQNPLWWRYTILRHRYIEPLHPDEFVEGGRMTETLLARMGIPSPDTYFDERNRAIREVAHWLLQQAREGSATPELRALALDELQAPLQRAPGAAHLLEIAAIFGQSLDPPAPGSEARDPLGRAEAELEADTVFPQALLLEMARHEQVANARDGLAWLIRRRYVQAGDDNRYLWMSPVLQAYLYARQDPDHRKRRHSRIARYFQAVHEPLHAARHHLHAGEVDQAAALLLAGPLDWEDSAALDDLANLLRRLSAPIAGPSPVALAPDVWSELQIRLADLEAARGARPAALAACRRGLQTGYPQGIPPRNQARIYRRMGKLYEKHNQLHALGYYEQAGALFDDRDPEVVTLLKDRGWLYILRQAWTPAEADLRRALHLAGPEQAGLRADIHDALASLYRHQKDYARAIEYARRALHERERVGDLLRVAHSFNNLGLIYNELGDYAHAIAAFEEARTSFERLGNQELIAGAHLNTGMAHHLDGRLPAAIEAYRACLTLCQAIELPLVQARAHANLVEVYLEQDEVRAAGLHWRTGMALSQAAGFDDEIAYYMNLRAQSPALAAYVDWDVEPVAEPTPGVQPISAAEWVDRPSASPLPAEWASLPQTDADAGPWAWLDPDSRAVVELAQTEGRVTPRRLMAVCNVSKATATRRLTALVEQGLLMRHGEGRGVCYTLAAQDGLERSSDAHLPSQRRAGGDRLDVWRNRLAAHHAELAEAFGVVALAVDPATMDPAKMNPAMMKRAKVSAAAGGAASPVCWYAEFIQPPDLDMFFELETQLGAWLGEVIDLKPESWAPNYSLCVAVWRAAREVR